MSGWTKCKFVCVIMSQFVSQSSIPGLVLETLDPNKYLHAKFLLTEHVLLSSVSIQACAFQFK